MNLARRKAPGQNAGSVERPQLKLHQPNTQVVDSMPSNLDENLLRLCASGENSHQVRARLRELVLTETLGAGACHVRRTNDGWSLLSSENSGHIPRIDLQDPAIIERLDHCLESTTISLEKLPSGGNGPVLIGATGGQHELLLVFLSTSSELTTAIKSFEKILLGHRLLGTQHLSAPGEVETLASLLDLTRLLAESSSLTSGCREVVNALSDHFRCNVALGTCFSDRRRPDVQAISGLTTLEAASDIVAAYQYAMTEPTVRCERGQYPPLDTESNHLLLAHKQLATAARTEAVLSSPIYSPSGEVVGVLVLTGSRESLNKESLFRLLDLSATPLGSQLHLLRRSEPGLIRQKVSGLLEQTKPMTRWLVAGAVVLIASSLFIHVPYHVRTGCQIEPLSRRFAVAPFEGLIKAGFVKPGDVVQKDERLAEMDGQSVRWRLLGVTAQKEQSIRKGQIKLAQGNPAETIHADLESQKLDAETNVLLHQQRNLMIRSPISGVILDGSLERSEAASVTTGQVLFEIAPLDEVNIQIAIPAEDVAHVDHGAAICVWLEGSEEEPIQAELECIHPRSTIRDGRNVFLAEVTIDNRDLLFRPGLNGNVRIDGGTHPLWWTLFHKPINFVRSRFTFW